MLNFNNSNSSVGLISGHPFYGIAWTKALPQGEKELPQWKVLINLFYATTAAEVYCLFLLRPNDFQCSSLGLLTQKGIRFEEM